MVPKKSRPTHLQFPIFYAHSIPYKIATLSDLLAAKPLVDRSPFGDAHSGLGTPAAAAALSSAREREYQIKLQHLTELLNESEANHQRLLDQEKVLFIFLLSKLIAIVVDIALI
jgi:hypothetical protein